MTDFDPYVLEKLRKFSPGDLCESSLDMMIWKKHPDERPRVGLDTLKEKSLFVIINIILSKDRRFIEAIKFDGNLFFICELDFCYFCKKADEKCL